MNDTISQEDKLIQKIVRSEWTQILTVIVAVAGLFFWSTSIMHTSITAMRQDMNTSLTSMRQEMNASLTSMHQQMYASVEAMRQESKDFHGRLCTIEERNKE